MRIEPDLRQKAKIISAELGQSIQTFVSVAVRERIQQYENRKAQKIGAARERQVEFLSV